MASPKERDSRAPAITAVHMDTQPRTVRREKEKEGRQDSVLGKEKGSKGRATRADSSDIHLRTLLRAKGKEESTRWRMAREVHHQNLELDQDSVNLRIWHSEG